MPTKPEKPQAFKSIPFAWWNTDSFAHFDSDKTANDRWPKSPDHFGLKLDRVVSVLRGIIDSEGTPALLALGEVTARAAKTLQRTLFPEHHIFSLDLAPERPEFNIAVMFDAAASFTAPMTLIAPNVSEQTRPMIAIDYLSSPHRVRFIVCHWTAPFDVEQTAKMHGRLADFLAYHIYSFLHAEEAQVLAEKRHVVVMGDFNTEPFGLMETHFDATRSRDRARKREDRSDQFQSRVRLYNCGWRLLGESTSHSPGNDQPPSVAGTWYDAKSKRWKTVDQVLVTGSLLSGATPCLLEAGLRRFVTDAFAAPDGTPSKFLVDHRGVRGVSDHLPLVGAIAI